MFDNESLSEINSKRLGWANPSFTDLNRLVAQMMSSVTTPLRFGENLNTNLKDIETDLVNYARQHFLVPSYSPFSHKSEKDISVSEITRLVFKQDSMMIKWT